MLPVGALFYAYYTAFPERRGSVFCRISADLDHWSHSIRVAYGGQAGTSPYSAECPHVVLHEPSGRYYLFRTQSYGEKARTSVYRSENPLAFGIDDDRTFVGLLPVAAPEVVLDGKETYIASLLPSLKGIRVARMAWVPQPSTESRPSTESQPSTESRSPAESGRPVQRP